MSNVLVFPKPASAPISSTSESGKCRHEVFSWRELELSVCPAGGESAWSESGEAIDGAAAMAVMFGDFDLVGVLPSLRTAGDLVLVYSPSRGGRARMATFPPNRWIEGAPGLWFSHDGEVLLLSPDDPLLTENLLR